MAKVSVVRTLSYGKGEVASGLVDVLRPFGGMEAFVSKGDVVLVKPNFLTARTPDKCVSPHPQVIAAVAEAAARAGAARVLIGDSPGIGSGKAVARKLGLPSLIADLPGVELVEFETPVTVENRQAARFRRLEIERTVLEVDKLINLGKVKTHAQMFLTLAVKNTFGCVVGPAKAAWHMEAGRDEELFATMLLDLHMFVRPVLSILDGIVMMEGNGPSAGRPRDLGLLFASTDAVALDHVVCDVLSVPVAAVPTNRVAASLGFEGCLESKRTLVGVDPSSVRVESIEHPRPALVTGIGGPLQRLARRLMEVRPVVDPDSCTGCLLCQRQCPASAISPRLERSGRTVARIHPNLCIHCYCCQELCPEGAIGTHRGLARKLLVRTPTDR